MIPILVLNNGKKVYIQGKEITRDGAHEIITKLTKTYYPNKLILVPGEAGIFELLVRTSPEGDKEGGLRYGYRQNTIPD